VSMEHTKQPSSGMGDSVDLVVDPIGDEILELVVVSHSGCTQEGVQ